MKKQVNKSVRLGLVVKMNDSRSCIWKKTSRYFFNSANDIVNHVHVFFLFIFNQSLLMYSLWTILSILLFFKSLFIATWLYCKRTRSMTPARLRDQLLNRGLKTYWRFHRFNLLTTFHRVDFHESEISDFCRNSIKLHQIQ